MGTEKNPVFLTNGFILPPLTVAELYRSGRRVGLFLKWIRQNLRIKSFFGTSENAVKTRIWIAVSVLVAIIRSRLRLDMSLHTILQIPSVTPFEKTPLDQLLSSGTLQKSQPGPDNQLNLFD